MGNTTSAAGQCPDCAPYPTHPAHHSERFVSQIDWLSSQLLRPVHHLRRSLGAPLWTLTGQGLATTIDIALGTGFLTTREVTVDDTQLPSNGRLIATAAKQHNARVISLRRQEQPTNIFRLESDHERFYYEGLPLVRLGTPTLRYDSKVALKSLLKHLRFPHVRGRAFTRIQPAKRYAQALDRPVVIKPAAGSLSRHTYVDIQSDDELDRALRGVKQITHQFLVEEYIPGSVWRVTFIGREFVAACRRDPASVVGNGKNTLGELISKKEKGREQRVGRSVPLLSPTTKRLMQEQGLTEESVLPSGTTFSVQEKVIAALGADFHDVTDTMHSDNIELLGKLVRACNAPILGIDLIAPTLSEPITSNGGVMLEVNSLPSIELHHFPASGTPRDVAGRIVAKALAG